MIFRETPLPGAWVLEPERFVDERGFFARTFCRSDFVARGLEPAVAQCSVSYNHRRGTVRGLHFQIAPHEEVKLVRVTRGALWDVIVDMRPESPAFRQHFAVVLSADAGNQLYIPKGMAHGFQTLADGTEVSYQISKPYAAEAARGYRWNDPVFAIPWPEPVTVISEKDRNLPLFSPSQNPHPLTPSPAPSHPPTPGEGEKNRKTSAGCSPSSPGVGGWEGAGEEGRGDEGLSEERR
jgi:dTDP-4-dehydrorhamnose 3,5-epimerase